METSAIVTMSLGMLLIWGGLAASVIHAVRTGRRRRAVDEDRPRPGSR